MFPSSISARSSSLKVAAKAASCSESNLLLASCALYLECCVGICPRNSLLIGNQSYLALFSTSPRICQASCIVIDFEFFSYALTKTLYSLPASIGVGVHTTSTSSSLSSSCHHCHCYNNYNDCHSPKIPYPHPSSQSPSKQQSSLTDQVAYCVPAYLLAGLHYPDIGDLTSFYLYIGITHISR